MKFNSIILLPTAVLFVILAVSTSVEGKRVPEKLDIPTSSDVDRQNNQQEENNIPPPPPPPPAAPIEGPAAEPIAGPTAEQLQDIIERLRAFMYPQNPQVGPRPPTVQMPGQPQPPPPTDLPAPGGNDPPAPAGDGGVLEDSALPRDED